jgi:plasmid stabilization system protein ParE
MATYRLSENAREDLHRIYRRGLRAYGEAQADEYYNALFGPAGASEQRITVLNKALSDTYF